MPKTKILLLSLFVFFISSFPLVSLAQSSFDYKTMEGIPGVIEHGQVYTFNQYVSAVYNFAIWAVGIAALLMISIGAYMYLTSAGNNAAMSSAKGVITDALIGLVLALFSWLLLYIINPDLVNPVGITGGAGTGTGTGTGAEGTPPAQVNTGNAATQSAAYRALGVNPTSTSPIDYTAATNNSSLRTSAACKSIDFTNSSNEDQNLLRAIAHTESNGRCNSNAVSDHGACGVMQMTPETARGLDSSLSNMSDSQICSTLAGNNRKAIDLAALYVSRNKNSAGVQAAQPQNRTAAIFAGYNTGYSTAAGSSVSGRNPALAASVNCTNPQLRAFECPQNTGGLSSTIQYAYNGTGLYSKYSNGQ